MSTETPGNPAARELGYCPCCGYLTLPEGKPGSYDVCDICHWTDDAKQFTETEYVSTVNEISLAEARTNFRETGAVTPAVREETCEPGDEQRDPNWPY